MEFWIGLFAGVLVALFLWASLAVGTDKAVSDCVGGQPEMAERWQYCTSVHDTGLWRRIQINQPAPTSPK